MTSDRFSLASIERVAANGETERLSFEPGLNLLVGRPNTGKTIWLRVPLIAGFNDQDELHIELAEKATRPADGKVVLELEPGRYQFRAEVG